MLISQRKEIKWGKSNIYEGSGNPNFNGGQYFNKKGYVKVLRPDHPDNDHGYVYMHRLVMEEWLQRPLKKTEVVHHINEIKCDNRRENLFLTTIPEHSAIHRAGKKQDQNYKTKMRRQVRAKNKNSGRKRNAQGQFEKAD